MKKTIFVLFFIFIGTSVYSQQALNIDLQTCIDLAVKNNNSLAQSRLEYDKAREQINEAYGTSVFPNIDGVVNYSHALKRPEFILETPFFSGSFPAGSENTLTASVTLRQPLFSGAMFLAVNIAETYAELAGKAAKYSESELIKITKEAYYTRLLADALVDLAELQVERAKQNVKNAKSLYDAGLIAEYDYIRANVEEQNLLPVLTGAKNQVKLAENNLKFVIGLDADTEININEKLNFITKEDIDFEEGLNWVYKNNYQLQQSELNVELNDLNASYQWTQHLPQLEAFGNWQTQAQENNNRAFNNWRYKNSSSVGLTLKVPIFKGFATNSRVEQAEIDYKKSLEGLAMVKKNLRNDYENTQLEINKVKDQIEAYNKAVDQAEMGYNISQKRFSTGLSTQLEVTDAMLNFTSAKINYLRAVHEYYVKNAKLSFLLGKLK